MRPTLFSQEAWYLSKSSSEIINCALYCNIFYYFKNYSNSEGDSAEPSDSEGGSAGIEQRR